VTGADHRLGVGIVGLGRLWKARYRPALERMTDRFRIIALHDQVAWRARIEAAAVGATATPSLTALTSHPEVEAVLLLTPQWWGGFAAERAVEAGKALFWAVPLGDHNAEATIEAVAETIRRRGGERPLAFVPELPRRAYPVSARLRELLETSLGPARLILGQVRVFGPDREAPPGPGVQLAPASLGIDPGENLIDWCRFAFGAEPVAVESCASRVLDGPGPEDHGFESVSLHFPGGRLSQVSVQRYHRGPWGDLIRTLPRSGFQVFAEHGAAFVEMPDRVVWSCGSGPLKEEKITSAPSLGEVLLGRFRDAVLIDPALAPGLDDARAVSRLARLAREARHENRRKEVPTS
jgi:predicted dehydrogenase